MFEVYSSTGVIGTPFSSMAFSTLKTDKIDAMPIKT